MRAGRGQPSRIVDRESDRIILNPELIKSISFRAQAFECLAKGRPLTLGLLGDRHAGLGLIVLPRCDRVTHGRKVNGRGNIMTSRRKIGVRVLGVYMAAALAMAQTEKKPVDPGVRGGVAGAGGPLKGLTADEATFFQDGLARFAEIESVTGGQNNGLGPRFNSNQCFSCHAQPAGGGFVRRGTR